MLLQAATGLLYHAMPWGAGPVTVIGVREGSLWLVDSRGQPHTVPVNHPGLKARCLSAQGDSQAARLLAERGEHASASSACVVCAC